MALTMEPAYNLREEITLLFREYTEMLVRECPAFAGYLKIQNYDAEMAGLRHKYGPPAGRLYLARLDGDPAGCAAIRKLDGDTCELKRMYVRPGFRGQRIAAALLDQLLSDARRIGYRRMNLDTLPFLTTAIAMYRARGFYDIPRYNDSPLPETIYLRLDL